MAIALAVLSGCCVLGRFFSRVFVVKHVGAADYLIAGAWMAAVAMAVVARRKSCLNSPALGVFCHYRRRLAHRCFIGPKPDFDEDHESPDTMLLRVSLVAPN